MNENKEWDQMSAKELLAFFGEKSYREAREAKQEGRLVCWSASVAPDELCRAMDIAMVYPENHAAAIGAKKGSQPLLELAERKGYFGDCCSYARVNMGYLELLKEYGRTGTVPELLAECPGELCPLPDLVITCSNLCNTLLKWYENLAAELGIPCICIDTPYNYEMPVSQRSKDYIKGQLEHAVTQLEQICGRPFDWQAFYAVQEQSQRSIAAWDRVASMAAYKPSPLNGFDFFNYMALIVCARGTKESEIVFSRFADELEENLKNGRYAFGEHEAHRVAWEGIACWPYLGYTFKTFKRLGMLLTGSGYPDMWSLHYEPGNLDSMAEAYASIVTNRDLNGKAQLLGSVVEHGKCSGVVYHVNRSCKIMSFLSVEVMDAVQEMTGVPFVFFDGDQTDPKNFASAPFETRVETLAEMMTQKAQMTQKEGR